VLKCPRGFTESRTMRFGLEVGTEISYRLLT